MGYDKVIDLNYAKQRAVESGRTVDQVIADYQRAGYNINPGVMENWKREQATNPTTAAMGGRPLSVEQAQAGQAIDLGKYYAQQDPNYARYQQGEQGWFNELNPDTYNQYASRLGGIQSGVDPSQQQWGADQYRRWATGQDSVVSRETQLAREQLGRDVTSQIASARGGYNPALARAGVMSRTQGMADLGAQGALNMARERQSALGGYMGAQGLTDELRRGLAQDQERRVGQQAAMSGMADTLAGSMLGGRAALEDRYINQFGSSLGREYAARTPQMQGPGMAENIMGFGGGIGNMILGFGQLFGGR